MRTTFLTQYYPPEVGAPQARIAALARGLSAAGVEATVHTCFPHYPDGEIKAPYRNRPLCRELDGTVRVVRSAIYPAANQGFSRRLVNHLSFAASALTTTGASGRADVVVVETPPLFLAGAAIPYARMKRARLVVNVADLWPDSAIELGAISSPAAIRGARAVERAAYRAAAAITCPTERIAVELEQRPESRGKTVLMRPAVDLERFNPNARSGLEEAALTEDGEAKTGARPLQVLYAGTIGMAHGLKALVDAAGLIHDRPGAPAIRVTIAGGGAEADELRARIANGGFRNVSMLGVVPNERIPALYAACDVAIVMLRDRPILRGALPTKMLEAMAAGRPVVLAARGEAARLIERSGGGVVVEPENPSALVDALCELAHDRERRERLGQAGRRAVEAEFGREAWLHRWEELLHDCAAPKTTT